MFCSVCNSKKVESTISVWYLDRKQGEFPSLLGRKGALEFWGNQIPHRPRLTYSPYSCIT